MSAADEQPFLTLLNEHQGILHRVCQLYAPVGEERRDLDDLSYDEIGTIAGITTGNARVKMNRIREKLRVLLESDEL